MLNSTKVGMAGLLLVLLVCELSGQGFLWKYTSPTDRNGDIVGKIIAGSDGNIYLAGMTYWDDTFGDFQVISLTPSGGERWKFRIETFHNAGDYARSVTYANGRCYACGDIGEPSTSDKWGAVVCLNSSSGSQIWRYDDILNTPAFKDICADNTGNCYVVREDNILALSSGGSPLWSQTHNLGSVVYGADGQIYAAGPGLGNTEPLRVVSFSTNGGINWQYQNAGYLGPSVKVTYGDDGNIYVGGPYVVLSLDMNGSERWVMSSTIKAVNQISFANNRVYVAGMDASGNGQLRCYSNNGQLLWSYSGEYAKGGVIGLPAKRAAAAGYTGTSPNQKFCFAIFDSTGALVYSYTDTDTTRTYAQGGLCYVASVNVVAAGARSPWMGAYGFNPGTGIEEEKGTHLSEDNALTIYSMSNFINKVNGVVLRVDGTRVTDRTRVSEGIYFVKLDNNKFKKIIVLK